LYNRYRQFYESVIAGVLAYVVEVVPDHLLAQLDLLLEVAADVNKGNRFKVIRIMTILNFVLLLIV